MLWPSQEACSCSTGYNDGVLLQERRERHRQNYMHVTIHTSQTWADTFISELNDTHVEAELRTKHIPPQVRHIPAAKAREGCPFMEDASVSARQDDVQYMRASAVAIAMPVSRSNCTSWPSCLKEEGHPDVLN